MREGDQRLECALSCSCLVRVATDPVGPVHAPHSAPHTTRFITVSSPNSDPLHHPPPPRRYRQKKRKEEQRRAKEAAEAAAREAAAEAAAAKDKKAAGGEEKRKK